jgi:hypothetical protein
MILFGEASLLRALRAYVVHYHTERNHQGVGNRLLEPLATVSSINEPIHCRERVGGMLNFTIEKQLESTRSIYCTIRHNVQLNPLNGKNGSFSAVQPISIAFTLSL